MEFPLKTNVTYMVCHVIPNLTENVIQKHFYSAKADELLILFDEQDNSQS